MCFLTICAYITCSDVETDHSTHLLFLSQLPIPTRSVHVTIPSDMRQVTLISMCEWNSPCQQVTKACVWMAVQILTVCLMVCVFWCFGVCIKSTAIQFNSNFNLEINMQLLPVNKQQRSHWAGWIQTDLIRRLFLFPRAISFLHKNNVSLRSGSVLSRLHFVDLGNSSLEADEVG